MPRDPKHDPHYAVNRAWWDSVVPIHEASKGYDRDGFLRGYEEGYNHYQNYFVGDRFHR